MALNAAAPAGVSFVFFSNSNFEILECGRFISGGDSFMLEDDEGMLGLELRIEVEAGMEAVEEEMLRDVEVPLVGDVRVEDMEGDE